MGSDWMAWGEGYRVDPVGTGQGLTAVSWKHDYEPRGSGAT